MSIRRGLLLFFVFGIALPSHAKTTIDLGSHAADLEIVGEKAGSELGQFFGPASSGDLDGDGRNELIIAETEMSSNGNGRVFIFRGGGLPEEIVDLASPTTPTLFISGVDPGSVFGIGFKVADFDDDGRKDLLVASMATGITTATYPWGAIFVFRGKQDFFSISSLEATSADYIIKGNDADHRASIYFDLADINNDSRKDLIIGGDGCKRPGQVFGAAGRIFVLFGRQNWPQNIILNEAASDVQIYGEGKALGGLDRLGRTVIAGDLNADGIDDLIAFAWWGGSDRQGKGYVFYGRTTWSGVIDLAAASADVTIEGNLSMGQMGHALAVGDVDGDGKDDLLFSAFMGSTKPNLNNGVGYILFGSSSLPQTVFVATDPNVTTIHGMSSIAGWYGIGFGYQVNTGDFSGDGIADCVFGAVDAFSSPQETHGYAAILFGRSNWPREIDIVNGGYDCLIHGGKSNKWVGVGAYFVSLDDNDGTDLVLGDLGFSLPGRENCGKVYVLYGSESRAAIDEDMWTRY